MNKSNKSKIIFIMMFAGIIIFPYFNKIFEILENKELVGVTINHEKPQYGVETYIDGSYQQQFEQYYSQNFPNRNNIIKDYNQFKYSLFKKGSVVIGKENYLFEEGYITEYLGIDSNNSEEKIKELVNDLKVINDICQENDKEFYIIVTPSKADYYSEYIPDRYLKMVEKNEEYIRNYNIFLELLNGTDINYFNSCTYIDEIRDEIQTPLFYKTGTHWSFVTAAHALSNAIDYINDTSDLNLKELNVIGIEEGEKPFFYEDIDIYNLLNIKNGEMENTYHAPKIEVNDEGITNIPKLFMQGGSFSWQLLFFMNENNIFNDIDFMFYQQFIRDYKNNQDIGISNGQVDKEMLDELLDDKDVIILEVNQQAVGSMGSGFPKVLKEYLEMFGF